MLEPVQASELHTSNYWCVHRGWEPNLEPALAFRPKIRFCNQTWFCHGNQLSCSISQVFQLVNKVLKVFHLLMYDVRHLLGTLVPNETGGPALVPVLEPVSLGTKIPTWEPHMFTPPL